MATLLGAKYEHIMNWTDRLALFSQLDYASVIMLFAFWVIIGWLWGVW